MFPHCRILFHYVHGIYITLVLQVLRIDITSLNPSDNSRTIIDSAVRVHFTPQNIKQLLVTTSAHKLLKFDARSGKILAEVCTACVFGEGGIG